LRNIGLEVTGLHLAARRSWTADLEDGAVIRFGQDDGEDRLERFVTAWPSIAGSHGGQLESADLRYPNGFAVDWRESATGTAEQRRKD
jgi:cell division protein FtsQ